MITIPQYHIYHGYIIIIIKSIYVALYQALLKALLCKTNEILFNKGKEWLYNNYSTMIKSSNLSSNSEVNASILWDW